MRYQQPQSGPGLIDWFNPLTRGAQFAYLPGIGFTNLVDNGVASQQTGGVKGVSPVGITFDGSGRAEFQNIGISGGLTIISIWRARPAGYLSADGTRHLLSTRDSSNHGWSYGRSGAVAGGASGNVTRQSMTFQGLAQYDEANCTIESLVDTPVACRYNGATQKLSWFRFGVKSSPDTSTGTPTDGNGSLILGAQGPFSSNANPWIDKAAGVLVIPRVLSDAEIFALTNSVQSLWQIFRSPQRILSLPVAPAGTTIVPSSAVLTLTGGTPSVIQPQTIAPSAASLTLTGGAPTISQARVLSPSGASLALTGGAPTVVQAAPQTIAPIGAVLTISGNAPTVSQARTISPSGASIVILGNAPIVGQNVGGYPVFALATIMRQSIYNVQGGTLHSSAALSAGTMSEILTKTTIMRAQATSRTAAITSAPINLTAALL